MGGARIWPVAAALVVLGCSSSPIAPRSNAGAAGADDGEPVTIIGGKGGAAGATTAPPDASQSDDPCACPAADGRTVHLPLSCFCGTSAQAQRACAMTRADLDVNMTCGFGQSHERTVGCGKVSYGSTGYAGGVLILSQQTDAVVGVYQYSDIPFGPCGASSYIYGEALFSPGTAVASPADECADELSTCDLCGPVGSASACP